MTYAQILQSQEMTSEINHIDEPITSFCIPFDVTFIDKIRKISPINPHIRQKPFELGGESESQQPTAEVGSATKSTSPMLMHVHVRYMIPQITKLFLFYYSTIKRINIEKVDIKHVRLRCICESIMLTLILSLFTYR